MYLEKINVFRRQTNFETNRRDVTEVRIYRSPEEILRDMRKRGPQPEDLVDAELFYAEVKDYAEQLHPASKWHSWLVVRVAMWPLNFLRERYYDLWFRYQIHGNEFDPSLDLDLDLMLHMNMRQRRRYQAMITRRRQAAHIRDLQRKHR